MQRPTNSWVAPGRAGVSWWRKDRFYVVLFGLMQKYVVFNACVRWWQIWYCVCVCVCWIVLNELWLGVCASLKDALGDSLEGEKCLCSPVTLLTVLRVCVCPYAQCLHRCMDDSECPDKNRLPGDVSPAGAHCSGPHIGQESHSSTSYHALHSLFPKALATSSLNLACSWPLGCS